MFVKVFEPIILYQTHLFVICTNLHNFGINLRIVSYRNLLKNYEINTSLVKIININIEFSQDIDDVFKRPSILFNTFPITFS